MKKTNLLIGICLVASCASAFAGDSSLYMGVDAGSVGYRSGTTSNTSTAYGITGGYQLNKTWGAEAQYMSLGNYSGVATTAPNAGKPFTSKCDAFSLVATGKYSVADTISLYGKLGVANSNNNQNHSNGTTGNTARLDATYGLGAHYDLNAATGIRFGWDRYIAGNFTTTTSTTGTRNMDVWSLGAVYKF